MTAGDATELVSKSVALEKSLQTLIEQNMETLFGVRFLASEYHTGSKHRGRIDSLGIDENFTPVIFEYKRAIDENVINQGLFYLDWLLDHRAEFELLVRKTLDEETASTIDWRNPRLICIANAFTRYDEHAVLQINRAIELIRYRDFGGELLALELVTTSKADAVTSSLPESFDKANRKGISAKGQKTFSELLVQSSDALKTLHADLERYCQNLGDDVTMTVRKNYTAFRRLKNFACVEVHPQSNNLLVYLKVDPDTIDLTPGYSRDVRAIGHFGTGDLELRISTSEQLQQSLPLIRLSYEAS